MKEISGNKQKKLREKSLKIHENYVTYKKDFDDGLLLKH